MTDFETVYQALFTLLSTAAGFNTKSRRLEVWSDVPTANMPALFVSQVGEDAEQVKGLPTKWRLSVDVYVYVDMGSGQDVVPAQLLNPIIGKIRELLQHSPVTSTQTLGGLAEHCWISGPIEIADAGLSTIGVAIIPVDILVA